MMKNVKSFGILILIIFSLGGCAFVDGRGLAPPEMTDFENGLDYFEAKIDYFEAILEQLESKAAETNADPESILLESQALLDQITVSRDGLSKYTGENFERLCVEDGGTFTVDEGYVSSWCEHPPYFESTPIFEKREDISNRFSQLIPQVMSVEFALFDSLSDFEILLDGFEADFNKFESEFDERLAYIEANNPELWYIVYYHNGHWNVWGDIMPEFHRFRFEIDAIRTGMETYSDVKSEYFPRQFHTRLNDFNQRLSRIAQPFRAG